jgi:putative ABC transport system permease protein
MQRRKSTAIRGLSGMMGSYLKTASRNLARNPLFSFINIVGLAVSMTVGLLLIGVLSDLFSYDDFHTRHERIYRVLTHYRHFSNENIIATTSLRVEDFIRGNTGEENKVAIMKYFSGDADTGVKTVPLSGYWANPEFFDVFSFPLLKGQPQQVLKQPYSMVITETASHKLFGAEDPLGKVVTLDGRSFTVTGILKDIPFQSHIKTEMLCSYDRTLATEMKGGWGDIWFSYVYLLLPENIPPSKITRELSALSAREPILREAAIRFELQPLDDIMFDNRIGNQSPVVGSNLVMVFGALTVVVMLSACFNYTNLSVARGMRRTREVGIRKVLGAGKRHLVIQFMTEAVLISFCALGMALLFFYFVRPSFLSIEPEIGQLFRLQLTPALVAYFLLFALVIGLLVGLFPSLFFARFPLLQVLKNTFRLTSSQGFSPMNVLVVFQYTVSIIFITCSIGIYHQYKHFLSFDLGFNTHHILNIYAEGKTALQLENELTKLPEVTGISRSVMIPGIKGYDFNGYVKYSLQPHDSIRAGVNTVDENYLPLHEHSLVAGRNFVAKPTGQQETDVIVNQSLLKELQIHPQNPDQAIGEVLHLGKKNLQIVGVVKDFQFDVANEGRKRAVVFRYSKDQCYWLNVRVSSTHPAETFSKIEAAWKKTDPVHPLESYFYDDQIASSFSGMKASVKLVSFLAFLAICISLLGLLGMVVFTTEIKVKEISIRKVLGASDYGLLFFLSKGFFSLLLLAATVGVLITYLLFEQVVFTSLVNAAPLPLLPMMMGVAAALLLAMLMVLSQTFKVARTNPAETLRSDQ